MQWNLDVTKGQGTGKVCSLLRGFVKSRFFPIYFTATGAKNIVRYSVAMYITEKMALIPHQFIQQQCGWYITILGCLLAFEDRDCVYKPL